MENVEAVYLKHKNLKLAAQELGMKWQNLYVQLKKLNVAITGDKAKYGSDKDKLAAQAELIFKNYVPNAINQNEIKFQSKCDFIINEIKIDIKASKFHKGCQKYESRRWAFSIKKQELIADFFVCFGFYDDMTYKVFLIPNELVKNYQTISVSPNGKSKWLQYLIDPNELNEFFNDV